MVWLIVIVAMVLVIGPVLYLLPGRQEKVQARLRAAARAAGLVVELATVYKLESEAHERVSAAGKSRTPRFPCARYGIAQSRPLTGLAELHLVRGRTLPWQTVPDQPPVGNPELEGVVRPFLDRLPGGARGLSVTSSLIWMYWLESVDSPTEDAVSEADAARQVSLIAAVLKDLRTTIATWYEQRLP
jgi:hypothetical protein